MFVFQHEKIIQKIYPKSTVFLKLKTIGSHLKRQKGYTPNEERAHFLVFE